jgi:uncharacterized protein (DUF1684 family)
MRKWSVLLTAVLLAAPDPAYRKAEEEWRKQRETALKAEDGWLSVAGLYWLHEGANSCGSAEGNEVQLPAGGPAKAGTFLMTNRKVTFQPVAGAPVRMNAPAGQPLRSDVNGPIDYIQIGGYTVWVIERGKRVGIRLRDKNSKMRTQFKGLTWFPVDEKFRLPARWVTQKAPLKVQDITGAVENNTSPGYAVFTFEGREYKLIANPSGEQIFFVFRDETTGKTTYPAGRFLYADAPQGGRILMDFNRAISPPCAYTPYATCPLPPIENSLSIPVQAGEKYARK